MTDMLRSGELPMYMLVLPIVHFIVLIGIMALAKEKSRSKLTGYDPFLQYLCSARLCGSSR